MNERLSRRNFLRLSAVAAGGVVLAACGGATTSNTPTTAPTSPSPSPASSPTPAASAAVSPSPSPAASPTPLASPTTSAMASPTPQGPEPTPIGQKLDLAILSPSIPDPSQPVTITFASWVSAGLKPYADEFQKLHPNIKIKFQDVDAENIVTKITTQIAGGNAPDAAYLDLSAVTDFGTRNALVELDSYIQRSRAVDPKDYVGEFAKAAQIKGHFYGLPFDGESTGIFYRTDLFEQAGLEPPRPDWTWEDFEEAAKKLTIPSKRQYGFAIFASEANYYWLPWLWSTGGRLMSPDGKIMFNDANGKKAAEFYLGLKKYSPPDLYGSNSWDGRVAFAQGKVAMYEAGAWFAGTLLSEFPKTKGKWGAAAMPRDKYCATVIAGDALVIFAQSKNKDAAWKWIEFLSAPQNVAKWNTGTPKNPSTLLPVRKSLLNNPNLYKNVPLLKDFAQMMKCGVSDPAYDFPYWGQIDQVLNENFQKVIYGEMDAATALDDAAARAEEIIQKHKS